MQRGWLRVFSVLEVEGFAIKAAPIFQYNTALFEVVGYNEDVHGGFVFFLEIEKNGWVPDFIKS